MNPPPTRQLPNELGGKPWWRLVLATFGRLMGSPRASFSGVPETVDHARVLGFVASLRLPLWIVLLALLLVRELSQTDPEPWRATALGQLMDVALVDALSLWLLFLVPLGLPLLYFVAGILAHVALGLTGGARQSIGATMRAFGYTAAPALLVISGLDLALYSGMFSDTSRVGHGGPEVYTVILALVILVHYVLLSLALSRTHRVNMVRALLTGLIPALFFAAVTLGRASLELERFPFVPRPQPTPYAPIMLD